MHQRLAEIPIDGGPEKIIAPPRRTKIVCALWLPDRSGLVMSAVDPETSVTQLWHLSYPGGEERRLTNDLNEYKDISLTADGSAIIAQRISLLSQFWVAPADDTSRARQLSTVVGGGGYLDWTPDNQLVYDSDEGSALNIWKMAADGSQRQQLTQTGKSIMPSATSDGRFIVFVSTRSGSPQLWRIDADGGNPRQLTNSSERVAEPRCSMDGQWVFYQALVRGYARLWRVAIDGGAATQVFDEPLEDWAVSPDSKLLAYSYVDEAAQRMRVAVVSLADDGSPVKSFDIITHRKLEWAKDGSGFGYVNPNSGALWFQPLDSSQPKQLIEVQLGLPIINFAWSPDGKQLAYIRQLVAFDAVSFSLK